MVKPQLALDTKEKPPRVPRQKGYVIQPKFNGWRWMAEMTENGLRQYSGRNALEANRGAEEIAKALEFLPVGTILDGEIVETTGTSNVSSVLAGTPAGKSGRLTFYVFDVLQLGDEDKTRTPFHQRRKILEELSKDFDGDRVQLVPQAEGSPDQLQKVHEKWLELGMEGSVAKQISSRYRPGSRTRAWIKIKPQTTTEAVITGYVMGKGKDNGHLVGAFEIELVETGASTTVGVGGGVKTPEDGKAVIGKWIEIRHHGWIDDSGKVIHPVWKGWRPDRDKDAA